MPSYLVPLAISSQLDVTGEERIHAAAYVPAVRTRLPLNLTGDLANGYTGDDIDYDYHVFGGTSPYTVEVIDGDVPPGITINSDGHAEGEYTTGGTYVFTLEATDADGSTVTLEDTVVVTVTLYITGDPPDAVVGDSYSYTFEAHEGVPPYVLWELIDGDLPDGTILDPDTGEISGIPTTTGTFTFTIQVTDDADNVASQEFDINVSTGFGNIYVANDYDTGPSYYVIDGSTDTVVETGAAINGLQYLYPSLDETKLFFTKLNTGDLYFMDVATEDITTISSANNYYNFVTDSDQSHFYLISPFPENFFYKMAADGTILDTENVSAQPTTLCITKDNSKVYVGTYTTDHFYVYDTVAETKTSVTTSLNVTRAAALNADDTRYYEVCQADTNGVLAVYDTSNNTLVDSVTLPAIGSAVALNPDGLTLAVCDYDNPSGEVWIYDVATLTLQDTISVGQRPGSLTYTLNGEKLYVSNADSNNVSVIDTATNTVTTTIPTPSRPGRLVIL